MPSKRTKSVLGFCLCHWMTGVHACSPLMDLVVQTLQRKKQNQKTSTGNLVSEPSLRLKNQTGLSLDHTASNHNNISRTNNGTDRAQVGKQALRAEQSTSRHWRAGIGAKAKHPLACIKARRPGTPAAPHPQVCATAPNALTAPLGCMQHPTTRTRAHKAKNKAVPPAGWHGKGLILKHMRLTTWSRVTVTECAWICNHAAS